VAGAQLAGGGDDGEVAVPAFGDAAEEDADGAGVDVPLPGGPEEQPAGVFVAVFGDRSVVTLFADW
jgi:hypothetical protein